MIVAMVTGGVGVADQVEPEDRHPLAIMRRGQQPVNQPFVSVGTIVAVERVDFLRGGQPSQVETEPANQRGPVGLRGRLQAPTDEPVADERSMGSARLAGLVVPRPELAVARRNVGPMTFPGGTLLDPALDELDLRGREAPPTWQGACGCSGSSRGDPTKRSLSSGLPGTTTALPSADRKRPWRVSSLRSALRLL